MPVINNVTFLYTKIQSPVIAFNKVDTEFSVDCVISKVDAKALNKEYPKQKSKEYDNEEFKEKFGIEPPFPAQDEQFVLKLKKAHTKGGNVTPEKYFPRVFVETAEGNVDKTYEVLVSNGSTGKVSYRVKETDTYGNFIELQSVLVQNLIPYVSKSSGPGGDFGVTNLAEIPEDKKTVVKKQGDVPAKEKKAQFQESEDDSDSSDQSPF